MNDTILKAQEINITEVIVDTINTLCKSLISSIDNTIYPFLDKMVFIDDDILTTTYIDNILGKNSNSGLLILANALLFGFLLYYCIRLFLSHYAGNDVEFPYVFILRSVFSAIFMNSSFFICSLIVSITNQISLFICSLGNSIFNKTISFVSLIELLNSSFPANFNIFSLDGILSGMLSISSFSLVISFALRYIIVKVFILFSPFAFLCLMNKSTEGFFKSWYKCFLSLLLLQIIISIILILPYAIIKENSSSIFNKLLLVGSINALLKANQFLKEFMGGVGITTNFQSGISGIKSMIMR